MKKIASFFVLMCICTPFFAKDLQFEELLNNAATEICEEIEGKVKTIAILDVQTEYWAVSDYIVDELAHYFTRRFGDGNVIAHDEFTRSHIEKELKYQQSGTVSDETIQEIGLELGVDCVIIGDFTETSSGWQLIVKANQVETKKILYSWKGKVKKNDKEVKFQIAKSKKSPRPKIETTSSSGKTDTSNSSDSSASSSSGKSSDKNPLGLSVYMINQNDENTNVVHPKDTIRFKVSSDKNAYLAILCIDANGEEEWLPLQNNYIRAGESRIFPDIAGVVLKVQDGIFGNERVVVYAAANENELPSQENVMSTRKLLLLAEDNENIVKEAVEYMVKR